MQSSDAEVCGLCLELSDPQTQLGFLPWSLAVCFFFLEMTAVGAVCLLAEEGAA